LGIEQLENRQLMASSLTASFGGGVLFIQDGTAGDAIHVRQLNGQISIDGVTTGAKAVDANLVSRIKVEALGGHQNIDLEVQGYNPSSALVLYRVQAPTGDLIAEIDSSKGNDSISIRGYGSITDAPGEEILVDLAQKIPYRLEADGRLFGGSVQIASGIKKMEMDPSGDLYTLSTAGQVSVLIHSSASGGSAHIDPGWGVGRPKTTAPSWQTLATVKTTDGTVWFVGNEKYIDNFGTYSLFRWDNAGLLRTTVWSSGRPYLTVLNGSSVVLLRATSASSWDGRQWATLPSVSPPGGGVWFLGAGDVDGHGDRPIYYWNPGTTVQQMPGGAIALGLFDGNQVVAITKAGSALQWSGSKWTPLHQVPMPAGCVGFMGLAPTDSSGKPATYYWSATTGLHGVSGPITQEYQKLGGPTGILGLPTGDEATWTQTGSQHSQTFQNGDIYWSAAGGPHVLYQGAIRDKYNSLGGPASGEFLVSDEQPAADGIGHQVTFQDGSVLYWAPGMSEAHMMTGLTYRQWQNLFGGANQMGTPQTDEVSASGSSTVGFANGDITGTADGTFAGYIRDQADNPVMGYAWDSAGNLLSADRWQGGQHTHSEYAKGAETARYIWDSAGNPVSAFTWDSAGNVLSKDVWQGGQHTHSDFTNGREADRYVWDSAGNPVMAYTWDRSGNQLTKDVWQGNQYTHSDFANGREVDRYVWDSAGNPVSVYTWDSAGNPLSQDVWQGGQHTHSEYLNGLEAVRYVLNSADSPIAAYTWQGTTLMSAYTWDNAGNPLSGWSAPSFSLFGGGIVSTAKNIGGNLASGGKELGGAISSGAKNLGGAIASGAQDVGGAIASGAQDVGGAIASVGKTWGGDIAATAKAWGGRMSTWAKNLGGLTSSWSKQLEGGLSTGVAQAKKAGGAISSAMKAGGGKASDWMKAESGKASDWWLKITGDRSMTEQERRDELKQLGYTDVQVDIIETVPYSGNAIQNTPYGAVYEAYYDVALGMEVLVYGASGQDLTDQAIQTIAQYADESAFKAWLRYYGFNDNGLPQQVPANVDAETYLTDGSDGTVTTNPDGSMTSAGNGAQVTGPNIPSGQGDGSNAGPATGNGTGSSGSVSGGPVGVSTGGASGNSGTGPDSGSGSAGSAGGGQGGGSETVHKGGIGGTNARQRSENDFHQRLAGWLSSARHALNGDGKPSDKSGPSLNEKIKDWISEKAMGAVKDALTKVMTFGATEAKVAETGMKAFGELLDSTQATRMADTLKAHPNAKPVSDFKDLGSLDKFVTGVSAGGSTLRAYAAAQQGYTVWQTPTGEWVMDKTPGLVLRPDEYTTKLDPGTAQAHQGTASPKPVSDSAVLKDFVKNKVPGMVKEFGVDKLKEFGMDQLKDILRDK
jgi:hypothetical protein